MKFISPLFSISNQKFNVIILAAGLGRRLKPETDYLPKALVKLNHLRAIDYIIMKYQYLADSIIIAIGYSSDLIENYVKGRYSMLNLIFSHEEISDLKGPGQSFMYALDYASSKRSTIVTFCDYVIDEQFSVEFDSICVCKPKKENFIYDTYKSLAVVDEGIVIDLVENEDLENNKENGFIGIGVFHDTKLLKSITYSKAVSLQGKANIDYSFDVVRNYIQKVRTEACLLSDIYEFGTEKTLKKTREVINGTF